MSGALLSALFEDMQVRNLSPHNQRAYVENVARFARHVGRSPAVLGPEEIHAYLVYLTTEKQLAPSSLVIAVCALRFLYKVTLKKAWPLDCVPTLEHRAILAICYTAGLPCVPPMSTVGGW